MNEAYLLVLKKDYLLDLNRNQTIKSGFTKNPDELFVKVVDKTTSWSDRD